MPAETITHLSIKGYKSIRRLDNFELRRFNVLIGANGSGKSNFIDFFQMLNFMFGSSQGNLQLFSARKGRANSLLYYGAQVTLFIDAKLQFDGDHQWSQLGYAFSLRWGAPDDLHFVSELLEYQRNGEDAPLIQKQLGPGHLESLVLKYAESRSDVRSVARAFRDQLRQIQVYHFYNTSEEATIRVTQHLGWEDRLMGNAGNLAAFLYNLQENNPAHYRRILSTVQLVAPFIHDFVVSPQVTYDQYVMLRWMDSSGETLGPHQLSDGTLRAIALITALLQPEETMPSIMIFDEPELGLHPAAIGLVAGLLKAAAAKRQVIIATQSPILIREYAPEDIIVVDREKDERGRGESTFTRLDRPSLEAWLEDFDLGELYEKNVTGGYPK